MDKILEFGKRALFIIRVLSGYEERRIRSYRLQLQKRIKQAQERKAILKKIPEQAILSEVRRMVEEMQVVQRKFEATETAIEEYLKPFDKNAEIIMNMQLEKEEKSGKEMLRAMHEQAIIQQKKAEEEKTAELGSADVSHHSREPSSTPTSQEQTK